MSNLCIIIWGKGCEQVTTMAGGSIPGQGIKILQATWHGKKKKKKIHHESQV